MLSGLSALGLNVVFWLVTIIFAWLVCEASFVKF